MEDIIMQYIIRVKDEIDFSDCEKAVISNYKWTEGYAPEAFAQLLYIKDKGFALKMTAVESEPRAVYSNYNDPVYKDSCLEFFVNFDNGDKYLNFEMNSNGAFLAAVRTDRYNKTAIDELAPLPEVKVEKCENAWTVSVFFSNEFIEKTFGKIDIKSGYSFKGNFYKCGDDTDIPHFGMWSPVDNETPDFHRPEFFGDLIVE